VCSIRRIERVPHISQCQECGRCVQACRVAEAAPGPIGGSCNLPSRNGIQQDIAKHAQEARAAFDNLRLISSLKHMADPAMAPVEPAAVRTVDVLHQPRQRMHGGPQQQVHVIRHQAVSVDGYREALGRSLEQREVSGVVDLVNEHFALVVPARHDVMQHSRCVEPQGTGHAVWRANAGPPSNPRISDRLWETPNRVRRKRNVGGRRCGQFFAWPLNAVADEESRSDPRPRGRSVAAVVASSVRLDRDFEDRFLEKSGAGQRSVRVLREEDREVTGRYRKPSSGGILVKLDVPLLVKCPSRSVTR
jgi:ferredoxin